MKNTFIKFDDGETLYEKIYAELLKDRIIYLNNDIDDNTVDMVTMQILTANEREKNIKDEDLEPIWIYINTCGGSPDVVLHLIQVIEESRIPIYGKVLSIAASAGLYLIVACKHRVSFKNSVHLLHKGSITIAGNFGEAEDLMEFYKGEVQDKLDDLLLRRTKITAEKLKEIRRNETYCLGQKALEEYGFIDEII